MVNNAKKLTALILGLLLALTLTACGTTTEPTLQAQTAETTPKSVVETEAPAEEAEPVEQEIETAVEEITAEEEGERILVVYFSSANTTGPDVVSGATPRMDDIGSTVLLAQYVHDRVGGDLAPITVTEDYPEDYNSTADQALEEQNADARPGFTLAVDPEEYDVIFIGYPIWWYRLPMILNTFFDTYDLSGKTIVPFNTHAGSRDGGTYQQIEELEPGATVLGGLAIAGERVDRNEDDVADWLASLGY